MEEYSSRKSSIAPKMNERVITTKFKRDGMRKSVDTGIAMVK